jgi:hypothetical protein
MPSEGTRRAHKMSSLPLSLSALVLCALFIVLKDLKKTRPSRRDFQNFSNTPCRRLREGMHAAEQPLVAHPRARAGGGSVDVRATLLVGDIWVCMCL